MAGSRSGISLLIDSPLRDLAIVMRTLPTSVKREVGKATKVAARPIWSDVIKEFGRTRLQQAALVKTAQVGVNARAGVLLKAGGKGRLKSGTPIAQVTKIAAYGSNPNREVKQRSRSGKVYTRKIGHGFPRGAVVHEAAGAALPRIASLYVQTTVRTVHEALEKVGK